MPSTNKTPNLNLSQFVANSAVDSDKLTHEDYNSDMDKIDAAVSDNAANISLLEGRLRSFAVAGTQQRSFPCTNNSLYLVMVRARANFTRDKLCYVMYRGPNDANVVNIFSSSANLTVEVSGTNIVIGCDLTVEGGILKVN